jgi:hypothetical protein
MLNDGRKNQVDDERYLCLLGVLSVGPRGVVRPAPVQGVHHQPVLLQQI